MYGIVGVEVLRCVTREQCRVRRLRGCALLVHEIVKNGYYRSLISDMIFQAYHIPRLVLYFEVFLWNRRA